jgi:hypothetical protein
VNFLVVGNDHCGEGIHATFPGTRRRFPISFPTAEYNQSQLSEQADVQQQGRKGDTKTIKIYIKEM